MLVMMIVFGILVASIFGAYQVGFNSGKTTGHNIGYEQGFASGVSQGTRFANRQGLNLNNGTIP